MEGNISKSIRYITSLLLVAVATAVIPVSQPSQAASIGDLLNRQDQLRKKEVQNKKLIEQKTKEANNLQDTIDNISNNIGSTEDQISNTQEQIAVAGQVITALQAQVDETQAKLDTLNDKLRTAYTNLYEMAQVSTMEVALQSDSLTDLVSHQQYIQSLQSQLQGNIEEANTLKADLNTKKQQSEDQKADLEQLNGNLVSSKKSLESQRKQKDNLLAVTEDQKAKYEAELAAIRKETTVVSVQLQKLFAEAASQSKNVKFGGTGGYPYAGYVQDSMADPWGFLVRECTSYAAWKWNAVYGKSWQRGAGPSGTGNAKNWVTLARNQGYSVGSSPRVGAIAVWTGGTYGHVAIVEATNNDGSFMVSEYNFDLHGSFSTRTVTAGSSSLGTPSFVYLP